MLRPSLPQALRLVSGLVLVAALVEVLFFDLVLAAPFVAAGVLFALSIAAARLPRAIAGLSVLLGIAVPIGASVAASSGSIPWIIPAFDLVVFGWLALVAARTLHPRGPLPSPAVEG